MTVWAFLFGISIIICCFIYNLQLAKGNSNNNSDFCSLFSNEEYEIIKSKRVRKEIRSLTLQEWDDFVTAMWIMKNTSQTDGELLYGNDFKTYDRLVCMHMAASINENGDQGHISQTFFPWHRGFELVFEHSLYAINPNITVPYWDYRLDVDDTENSIVFSNDYFGPVSSNDPQGTVTEGRFAYWPIGFANSSSNGCSMDSPGDANISIANISSPFGLLRGRINANKNLYLTRFGGQLCEFPIAPGSVSEYNKCLYNTSLTNNVDNLVRCFEGEVHGMAHLYMSGTSPYDSDKQKTILQAILAGKITSTEDIFWCKDWVNPSKQWEYQLMTFYPSTPLLDCLECRGFANGNVCDIETDDEYDCMCEFKSNNGSSDGNDDNNECTFNNVTIAFNSKEWIYKPGDMEDIQSSPNEPIFFLHHMNLDRFFMEWQLLHYNESSNYYGYYNEGLTYGGNLEDIMSKNDPFRDIFYEQFGDKGPYSAKDIFDYTTFLNAEYTYDTILELIKSCNYTDDEEDNPEDEEETCKLYGNNTATAIVACDNDPCDCDEIDLNCKIGKCDSDGCSSCKIGYWKYDYDFKCSSCQGVFGDNCLGCDDFYGCQGCKIGSTRVYDSVCDVYVCKD